MLVDVKTYDWLPAFLRHTPFSEAEARAILGLSRQDYARAVQAGVLEKSVTDFDDPLARHSGHSVWDMSLLASAIHFQVDPYRDHKAVEQIGETLDDLANELDHEPHGLSFSLHEEFGTIRHSPSAFWPFMLQPAGASDDRQAQDTSLLAELRPVMSALIAEALRISAISPFGQECSGSSAYEIQLDLFQSESDKGRFSRHHANSGLRQEGSTKVPVRWQNLDFSIEALSYGLKSDSNFDVSTALDEDKRGANSVVSILEPALC